MAHPPPCFGWRSAKCQLTGNLRLQTKRQRTESIQAYLFSPLLEAKLDRCSKLCATTLSLLDYYFFSVSLYHHCIAQCFVFPFLENIFDKFKYLVSIHIKFDLPTYRNQMQLDLPTKVPKNMMSYVIASLFRYVVVS
jgi:hypothetical protein